MKKIFTCQRKLQLSWTFLFLLFSITSLHAQTNVSGGIYTNTTWTLANSPYIVVDTVVVFPGVTLTIEPGVVVKFENDKQLEIRQATINAIGTSTDSITFTSNTGTTPGSYYGIYLHNGQYAGFKYCNFYFAANAIRGNVNDSLTVRNSNFVSNNIGVYFYLGAHSYFDSCFFSLNTSAVYGSSPSYFRYCSFVSNDNGISWCEWLHVQQCVINSNLSFGIQTAQLDTILNCEIKYNGVGLKVYSSGGGDPSYISENIIENNTIGMQLENGFNNDQIYCNKICNNTGYDLKTTLPANTNCVINNYWCSSDSAVISSHIWDGYDDASLGIVTFIPFDTTQCYLTGCLLGVTVAVTNATCGTCQNGSASVIVSNGFAPYTYTWYTSPLQTTQSVGGLAPSTYTVCVVDAHGCSSCDSTVFIDSTNCTGFSITLYDSNTTCTACNDGSAWVQVTGGTAPYYYTWYTAPIQTTDSAVNLTHGTYAVCVTDVYGCTACDSVTVGVGSCSAHFNLFPDSLLHHYNAVNMASGVSPLTYDWDWGDSTAHDTSPFPNHTYATSGFYTICLTITDSAGCTNTYCNNFYLQHSTNSMIYVNVIPFGSTGVNNIQMEEVISLSPNPANTQFTVSSSEFADKKSTLEIYNVLGKKIYSVSYHQSSSINCEHFPPGIYFVKLICETGSTVQKLVVERN